MKRPARGDNRAGQAIWAQGWMGARAKYGLGGGMLRSHGYKSRQLRKRSNACAIF